MRYSTSVNVNYLSMKINWEKWIFHWKKDNFEPIGNYKDITEFLILGKALLSTLYLYLQVYTTLTKKCLTLQRIISFEVFYF